MQEILDFLLECGTFYFATVEGDKPRVRPFGLAFLHQGRLYFGIGTHKAAWSQLKANPNVEISTTNANGQWLRLRGVAVMDDSADVQAKAFEVMPGLRRMYNEQSGWTLGLLYLKEGEAEFCSFQGEFRTVRF